MIVLQARIQRNEMGIYPTCKVQALVYDTRCFTRAICFNVIIVRLIYHAMTGLLDEDVISNSCIIQIRSFLLARDQDDVCLLFSGMRIP